MGKLRITGSIPVSHEQMVSNRESNKGLRCLGKGLPKREGRLAVVGGGPSVPLFLDQIRDCAEVWAINGACGFLKAHGIDSYLFAVDPHPIVAKWAHGASKAIFCDRVDPEAVRLVPDVRVYKIANDDPEGVYVGSSTATVAFHLGIEQGFEFIDFFGCESSFEDKTHAYQDEKRPEVLWVRCQGVDYLTAPDFYLQATEMSVLIRAFPKNFRHFGGGLLQALIEDQEHDIPFVSPKMMETIRVDSP